MPDSTLSNKRQRLDPIDPTAPPSVEDAFIQDQDAADSAGDDDDDEDKPKADKKAGRRKIKIEFIQDKSRRHITFSKRKAGIMKKVCPHLVIASLHSDLVVRCFSSTIGLRAFDAYWYPGPAPRRE